MTARHTFALLTAVAALLGGAGCGGGNSAAVTDETSDALYQQAQDLKKQGRNGEALNAFLKEIDRRGENGAPESHLEAGNLYRTWSRDPVEAYHHFNKYLEIQPVGPRSDMVRGQRDAAKREFLRMLVGSATDDPVKLTPGGDDVEQLRRRIQELEAENQTLRGASSVPVVRSVTPVIPAGDPGAAETPASERPVAAPANDSPFVRNLTQPPQPAANPPPTIPVSGPAQPRSAAPTTSRNVVAQAPAPAPTAERMASTPTRPGTTTRATPTAPSGSARWSHTVSATDKSLWMIARRYYGARATGAQVDAIFQANRDKMRSPSDLKPGMVLRIP